MNETYNKVFRVVMVYVVTILATSLLFGFILAIYATLFHEDSWKFWEVTLIYAIYTLPINVCVAVPFSWVMDYTKVGKERPPLVQLIFYLIAGSMTGFLYGMILFPFSMYDWNDCIQLISFGAISGGIFYMILSFAKYVSRRDASE